MALWQLLRPSGCPCDTVVAPMVLWLPHRPCVRPYDPVVAPVFLRLPYSSLDTLMALWLLYGVVLSSCGRFMTL